MKCYDLVMALLTLKYACLLKEVKKGDIYIFTLFYPLNILGKLAYVPWTRK